MRLPTVELFDAKGNVRRVNASDAAAWAEKGWHPKGAKPEPVEAKPAPAPADPEPFKAAVEDATPPRRGRRA